MTRYGGDLSDAPAVPDMPAWCFEEEQSDDTGRVDDDGHAIVNDDEDASVGAALSGGGEGAPGKSRRGKTSKFMEGNVEMVQQRSIKKVLVGITYLEFLAKFGLEFFFA